MQNTETDCGRELVLKNYLSGFNLSHEWSAWIDDILNGKGAAEPKGIQNESRRVMGDILLRRNRERSLPILRRAASATVISS